MSHCRTMTVIVTPDPITIAVSTVTPTRYQYAACLSTHIQANTKSCSYVTTMATPTVTAATAFTTI